MNMKKLRKRHRDRFTSVLEQETKVDEYIKVRTRDQDYIPFREWLRSLDSDNYQGKALQIRRNI